MKENIREKNIEPCKSCFWRVCKNDCTFSELMNRKYDLYRKDKRSK